MPRPTVVIDTSVLVVAAIAKHENYSSELLELIFQERLESVAIPEIIQEAKNVLARPKFEKIININFSQELLKKYEQKVRLTKLEKQFFDQAKSVCPDPKDVMFLALAAQVQADYLASLDTKHLLSLEKWQSALILKPENILNLL